jgi:carbamate kinase
MRILAALGGNALLKRSDPQTASVQRANVRRAAIALADLVKASHTLIVTHGNGPQIGLLAEQSMAAAPNARHPLDILGAETQGMIGYLIAQELGNLLPKAQLVVTVLTQVLVSADDPAFNAPAKPIGPVYTEAEANELARRNGWSVGQDGLHWRRVIASPEPRAVIEIGSITKLMQQGIIVICAGGGGIPVVWNAQVGLTGIEAVIDKDHASALLARELQVDVLLFLTDVDAVYCDFGTPEARAIHLASPEALMTISFAAGSMAPKIKAATDFVIQGKGMAAIGRLEDAARLVGGEAGTLISADHSGITLR